MKANNKKARKRTSKVLRGMVMRVRSRRKLNQRAFAKECGVSMPTIWRLERGMTISMVSQLRVIIGLEKWLLREEKKKLKQVEESL